MADTTLMFPVQETGNVGLSVEESHPEESKPSSEDPVRYVTSTDSSEDHNSPPLIERVSKETQTDFVPDENDPEPEVKSIDLEDITAPVSSDIVGQQKTPKGDERRDERKRRRKRKKHRVIEGREMVSPLSMYPKIQCQAPSLLSPAMPSDIFTKLAMISIFFVFLFGFTQGTPLLQSPMKSHLTGEWKTHSFAAEIPLCNVPLFIKRDDQTICTILSNCSQHIDCEDKESKVYWINNTSLLLLTKNPSTRFFLEYGPPKAAISHYAGEWKTHSFAAEIPLCNVPLFIKRDDQTICTILSNYSQYIDCEDKESTVYWISDTSLLLLTKNPSTRFFLEYGPPKAAISHYAGLFRSHRKALEHVPGCTASVTVVVILVIAFGLAHFLPDKSRMCWIKKNYPGHAEEIRPENV